MSRWRRTGLALRQLHVYVGLQASLALILMGISGLVASLEHRPAPAPPPEQHSLPVEGAGDRHALLGAALRAAGYPTHRVPPDWAIGTAGATLTMTVENANGTTALAVDTVTRQLTITRTPTALGEYLVRQHAALLAWAREGSLAEVLWAVYNQIAVFTLGFLVASSIILWRRRPGAARRGGVALGLGGACLVILYVLLR